MAVCLASALINACSSSLGAPDLGSGGYWRSVRRVAMAQKPGLGVAAKNPERPQPPIWPQLDNREQLVLWVEGDYAVARCNA
jgi:hypothetical protein